MSRQTAPPLLSSISDPKDRWLRLDEGQSLAYADRARWPDAIRPGSLLRFALASDASALRNARVIDIQLSHSRSLEWKAAEDVLETFESLEYGWDGYNADPPSGDAIGLAKDILDLAETLGMLPGGLEPSADGGITFTFLKGPRMAALECSNSGELYEVHSSGDGDPGVWEVETDTRAMLNTLLGIRAFLVDQ